MNNLELWITERIKILKTMEQDEYTKGRLHSYESVLGFIHKKD